MFRTEALQAQGSARYGSIVLVGSRIAYAATGASLLFIAVVIAYLAFGSVTRKAQVNGFIAPAAGSPKAVAPQPGIIVRKRVTEGSSVRQGDVLFVLSSERSASAGDTGRQVAGLLQHRRGSLEAEIEQRTLHVRRQLDLLERRRSELERELKGLGDQITMQEQRVAMAVESSNRYRDLQLSNYVSRAQYADRQAEVLDHSLRLADLRRVKGGAQRELIAAKAEAAHLEAQLELDQANQRREVAALSQDIAENELRREALVRAAADGTISGVLGEEGQSVVAGQPLASLLPASSALEAHLLVPSRAIGFLREGQRVRLRLHAFPYQKFGQLTGVVHQVPGSPAKPDELSAAAVVAVSAAEALYRVKVRLDDTAVRAYGQAQPLRAGMSLDATVVLETRRLYEWILDPVYAITGRM